MNANEVLGWLEAARQAQRPGNGPLRHPSERAFGVPMGTL